MTITPSGKNIFEKISRSSLLLYGLMFALMLLCYGSLSFYSEKIPVNDGVGFDGRIYAELTRQVPDLFTLGIPDQNLQRVLPSVLAYAVLSIGHDEITTKAIIQAFIVLNTIFVTLALVFFCLCMDCLGLKGRFKLVGAVACLLNFELLKFIPYDPVLTDSLALLLGSAMLFCHLQRRRLGLAVLTLAASFTWPSALIMGLLFLALPVPPEPVPSPTPTVGHRKAELALALAITLLFLALSLACFDWAGWHYVDPNKTPLIPNYQPDQAMLPVSYALMMGCFLFGQLAIVRAAGLFPLRRSLARISIGGMLVAITVVLGSVLLRHALFHSSPAPDGYNFMQIRAVMIYGVASPGRFLVPHLLYFGPFLLFTVYYWKGLCEQAARWGLGVPAVLSYGLLHSMDSESRHLLHLLPVVLLFTLVVMRKGAGEERERHPSVAFTALFIALTLACSRVWMRIGGEPRHIDINDLAAQRYFMHHGLYVTAADYALQAALVGAGAVLLAVLWRRNGRRGPGRGFFVNRDVK